MRLFSTLGVLGFVMVLFLLAERGDAAELNSTSTLQDTVPPQSIPVPTKFASAIEDLPLMPGLSPLADEDTLFVVPHEGRIAESVAVGSVDIDDVYKFYRSSLPQLGWKIVDGRTYIRANEVLRIDAHADGKVSTVRFSVKPK